MDDNETYISTKCPYCGIKVPFKVRYSRFVSMYVVECASENNEPCGRYFAANVKFSPVVTTYTMQEA